MIDSVVLGVRYLLIKGDVIPIYLCTDNLWRDKELTVYAVRDDSNSADIIDRCGIGFFSLDKDHPLTAACTPHEFMYSSPAYQVFHARKEADEELERLMKLVAKDKWYKIFAKPFKWISRIFGGRYWENDKTR